MARHRRTPDWMFRVIDGTEHAFRISPPTIGDDMAVPAWVQDTTERALKSAAQAGILFFGADQVNLLTVDWKTALGLIGGATLLSVLTSLASVKIGGGGTASLTTAVEPVSSGKHAAD